jgi:hypothetical protein
MKVLAQKMCAMEKDKKNPLILIAAELMSRSKDGNKASFNTRRLREEIVKEIEGPDEIFRKFRELLNSFREIIPDEEKRYQAAVKALACASGLSQKDIQKAGDNQLAELKRLEKGFLSALPGRRDEIKTMETKAREIRNEIEQLSEKIAQLEEEEQVLLKGKSSREEEKKLAEKTIGSILTGIAGEITSILKKVEEMSPPASADSLESPAHKPESKQSNPSRNCPMCGRGVEWYSEEKKWKCFSCAYEELEETDSPFPLL